MSDLPGSLEIHGGKYHTLFRVKGKGIRVELEQFDICKSVYRQMMAHLCVQTTGNGNCNCNGNIKTHPSH